LLGVELRHSGIRLKGEESIRMALPFETDAGAEMSTQALPAALRERIATEAKRQSLEKGLSAKEIDRRVAQAIKR
jgi:hypothetical protein